MPALRRAFQETRWTMQTTAGAGARYPESSAHPVSRLMAIALAVLALGCGIAGLFSLSTEMWGLGLTSACEIRSGLDNAAAETPLQVAVGV
jgi:hypothetical protein